MWFLLDDLLFEKRMVGSRLVLAAYYLLARLVP
jgi:hypothetical protein